MDLDEGADFGGVKLGLSFSNSVRVKTFFGHMIGQTASRVGSAQAVGKVLGQKAEDGAATKVMLREPDHLLGANESLKPGRACRPARLAVL